MHQKELLKKLIDDEVIIRGHKKDASDDFERGGWIFDFRNVMLDPAHLQLMTDVLYAQIADMRSFQIGGLESAAIPLITSLVLRAHQDGKQASGFYIRKSRKKTGLHKIIEGQLNDAPIVLVDDVMNSSVSFMRQIELLESIGKKVHIVLPIVRFRSQNLYNDLISRNVIVKNIFTLEDFNLTNGTPEFQKKDQRPYALRWVFHPEVSSHFQVIPRSTPAVHKDVVLFGSDDGYFRCFAIDSGAERWRFRVGRPAQGKSILSSPAVHQDVVYFGSYDGKLYALDIATGKPRWVFADCEWIGSSPAVNGVTGVIYVGLEHGHPTKKGSFVALDAHTGEKKWEYAVPGLMHGSPLILRDHKQVVVGGNEGVLYLFTEDGKVVWKFETEGGKRYGGGGFSHGDIKMSPSYDPISDQIAFGSMDGHAYVVDRKTGKLNYRISTDHQETQRKSGVYNSPVFSGDRLIFGGLDKTVYCCNSKTGRLLWKLRTGGRIFAAPTIRNQVVFIGSNDGIVYEIGLSSGEVLAYRHFPDRIVTPVIFSEEHECMFVRTNDSALFVVEPYADTVVE